MSNRDYREVQLSSSQLVFVFIAVLILGLVIFLLGVSVGKKQAKIVADAGIIPQKTPIKIEEKKEPEIVQKPKDLISTELESHQKIKEEVQKPKPPPKNLWYIQIGAFSLKENALSLADQYEKKGYPVQVIEPSSSDRNKLYKVRIGGYDTKTEAEKIKTQLTKETKGKERYLVVKD